jgi:hypothetical protein
LQFKNALLGGTSSPDWRYVKPRKTFREWAIFRLHMYWVSRGYAPEAAARKDAKLTITGAKAANTGRSAS